MAELVRVDGDTLGTVIRLVDPDQAVCQLKHVVTQTYDDKLCILGPLLNRWREQIMTGSWSSLNRSAVSEFVTNRAVTESHTKH